MPGKALVDLGGRPALARVIERVKQAISIDEVMVATTIKDEDDVIAALAEACGATVFRGSSSDVLLRYVGAAKASLADVVVRLTADCPLLDPEVIDKVVSQLGRADYCSNVVRRSYPRGLDVEAMPRYILERADARASSPQAREHVTVHIYEEEPQHYDIRHVKDDADNSDLNFCLDTEADLRYLRRLGVEGDYREVIARARAMR